MPIRVMRDVFEQFPEHRAVLEKICKFLAEKQYVRRSIHQAQGHWAVAFQYYPPVKQSNQAGEFARFILRRGEEIQVELYRGRGGLFGVWLLKAMENIDLDVVSRRDPEKRFIEAYFTTEELEDVTFWQQLDQAYEFRVKEFDNQEESGDE